eukprot:Nk52_evm10s2355 gene=Nk52_evmTU10s2355
MEKWERAIASAATLFTKAIELEERNGFYVAAQLYLEAVQLIGVVLRGGALAALELSDNAISHGSGEALLLAGQLSEKIGGGVA